MLQRSSFPFRSEGLGHFPTSNFQPTRRSAGGGKLPPLRVLLRRRFQKELVYGYIVAEHKLKEYLQTWVLPLVLNVRKVARRDKHFVAHFLTALPAPCPRRLYRCPKSLEVVFWYWSFCYIYSPYYILLFTFLLGYVYTVQIISLNISTICSSSVDYFAKTHYINNRLQKYISQVNY